MSTSVTVTSLADTLPLSVLKLEASGLNWAIFSLCFQDAVEAKGYWGHFDGTEPCPVVAQTPPLPPAPSTGPALPPATALSPTADKLAAIAQWDKDE